MLLKHFEKYAQKNGKNSVTLHNNLIKNLQL